MPKKRSSFGKRVSGLAKVKKTGTSSFTGKKFGKKVSSTAKNKKNYSLIRSR